jgi:hypothetical protein
MREENKKMDIEELNLAPTSATEPEPTENTIPTEQPPVTEPFLKVKYNKEEVELDREKTAELAQKGMNYEKAIERAREEAKQESYQAARDSYIAEQGMEWMGKPIKTEAEYAQAQKEKEIYDSLAEQKLPEEVINELIEGKRDRQERLTEKQQAQKESDKQKEFLDFVTEFPDVKPEQIPSEVWQLKKDKSLSLTDAYIRHEHNQLKSQVEATKINQQNGGASTGAISGQGTPGNSFFSEAQVKTMSQEDVAKNYDTIMESMKSWYK